MPRYTVPGPCKISWGGIDLGFTKAGVIIRPSTNLIPIIDDEHGTEPADWIRAGKSATVECVFNDPVKIKAAQPFIGRLLSNMSGANNQVGRLVNNVPNSVDDLGKTLVITERVPTNLWTALKTAPMDPQQLLLSSTQEFLAPILFIVALDDMDRLFSGLPSYIG
jgi:hypothetical protein